MDTGYSLGRILLFALTLVLSAVAALAEPCILAYPAGRTTFRYNPGQYEARASGDPFFDPAYSVGGLMLWDKLNDRIAFEIYQAPGLDAFVPSASGRNEFLFLGTDMLLMIDGFAEQPRQLSDLLVQFTPQPLGIRATIMANGVQVEELRHSVPTMMVSTMTPNGFFSNTIALSIGCNEIGCRGVLRIEIIVYQDRNGNRIFDGQGCYTVVMENFTVPVEESTWGAIKAIYQRD